MSKQAMCPDCDGMGVIHAAWGFWDGDNDENGVYVREEEDCPRCQTQGCLFGEEAERVLAARAVERERKKKELTVRKASFLSGLMLPSEWHEMEKGHAALEVIKAAKKAMEEL
jgi:ribosomal protein S27AE